METIATSVRIAGNAIGVLSALAEKLGQSKTQVVERALRELEERIFWAETSEAFARIAADPAESAVLQSEIDIWEQGTAKDYKGEEW